MRRLLLTTTALTTALSLGAYASAGIDGAHAADRLNAKVGGYMEQFVGYTSQDLAGKDLDGFDVKSDTEIFFSGSTVLDNGIEVGVNVQLEGNATSDQIDESYLFIKGGFGQLTLGSENSAMYLSHVTPASYGIGVNSGDNVEWYSFDGIGGNGGAFRGAFASTYLEPNRVNDANRITYFAPRFAGLRFGASYVPDGVEDSNSPVDRETSVHDGFTVSADYAREVGAFTVKLSAGYGRMRLGDGVAGDDPSALNVGARVSYGDVSAAASYGESRDDTSLGDMTGLNVGLNYEPGPWKIALLGFFSERDGSATANAGGSGARAASIDTVQIEATYALGPGVSFAGAVGVADIRDDSGFGEDSEAIYGVTALRLSF